MAITKTKKNKILTVKQRAQKALKLLNSGKWIEHIGSARPAKSIKYKTGETVWSIDPWKQFDHKVTFIQSLRWPSNNGGYLVMDRYGKLLTTTNITK